jgi:transposase
MRKAYPDDLTDKEWEQIEPLTSGSSYRNAGRKPTHSRREMLNAIFYLLRTGCQWRHLPHDFPPWTAVQGQYSRWKRKGVFQNIHDHLRKKLRVLVGKNENASAGIADSQSVKTTEKGGSKAMTEEKRSRDEKGI